MRLFTVIGALLVTAGAYLLISGGLALNNAISLGIFSPELWKPSFWLLSPAEPSLGLGANGLWATRLLGGLVAGSLGVKLIRITTS